MFSSVCLLVYGELLMCVCNTSSQLGTTQKAVLRRCPGPGPGPGGGPDGEPMLITVAPRPSICPCSRFNCSS